LSKSTFLDRAGGWLLNSGIQEPSGGVARYYLTDARQNRAVSTEITGYAVSAFTYLHQFTRDEQYLEAARLAATFLTSIAWDAQLRIFPFECSERPLAYFFDCGIIIRGLLRLWCVTGQPELLEIAEACGQSMAKDFAGPDSEFHPILSLPDKTPLPRTEQWSRMPGCYQLKAALAWHDLHKATGKAEYLNWYEELLGRALRTHECFLPGAEGERVMDRLHAYCYFLEGILPGVVRAEVVGALAGGIARVASFLHDRGPGFARSDVYAQLLRLRLLAERAGAGPVDRLTAASEANKLAGFQLDDMDPRIHGGFCFGRRGAELQPHINPVSTAFGMQALRMWRQYLDGDWSFSIDALI
jgi:hypothetical protein